MALALIREPVSANNEANLSTPELSFKRIVEIFQQFNPEINSINEIGDKYIFQAQQIFNIARKVHKTFLSQRGNSSISVDYLMDEVRATCSTQMIRNFPELVERIVEEAMQMNTDFFEDKGEM